MLTSGLEVPKSILTRGKFLQVFFQDNLGRYSPCAMKYQVVHKAMHCHGDQQSFENPYLIDKQAAKDREQHGVLPMMGHVPDARDHFPAGEYHDHCKREFGQILEVLGIHDKECDNQSYYKN